MEMPLPQRPQRSRRRQSTGRSTPPHTKRSESDTALTPPPHPKPGAGSICAEVPPPARCKESFGSAISCQMELPSKTRRSNNAYSHPKNRTSVPQLALPSPPAPTPTLRPWLPLALRPASRVSCRDDGSFVAGWRAPATQSASWQTPTDAPPAVPRSASQPSLLMARF